MILLALQEISKRQYVRESIAYAIGTVAALFISMRLCDRVSMHWYVRLPLGAAISVGVFVVVWWALFGRTKMFKRTVGLALGIVQQLIGRQK